jgi:signal transduction histidine kinase
MVQDLGARIASTLDNARFYRRSLAAVKAREEVLAFVAHDLRNPLHAALLSTAQLLNDSPAKERRRGWRSIERVHRMAERMSRMIDDLLDVASLDAGRLPIQLGPHDVRGLIADVLEELQSPAEEKGVELRVQLPAQPCVVRCDRRRILQVFSNVVSNAVKFTPRGGTITISSRNSGGEILFSIEDTGPGVPPENLQRLFERYWQADERSQKGRGLGLYIARRIVEAQSGVIWAESRPGAGTTISFSLPRDPDDRPPGPVLDA